MRKKKEKYTNSESLQKQLQGHLACNNNNEIIIHIFYLTRRMR